MSYEPKHNLEASQSPYKKDKLHLEPHETRRKGSVFSISARRVSISDEVFREITEEGPNYRDECPIIVRCSSVTYLGRLVG